MNKLYIINNPKGLRKKVTLDLIKGMEKISITEDWEKVNPNLKSNRYVTRTCSSSNVSYNWGGGLTPLYKITINKKMVSFSVKSLDQTLYSLTMFDKKTTVVGHIDYVSTIKEVIGNIVPDYFWEHVAV